MLGLTGAAPALANDLTFTLSNQSAADLTEFYASAANVDNWEENILGGAVLSAGASGEVTITGADDNCNYDLRMVFSDGDTLESSSNLCENSTFTIN